MAKVAVSVAQRVHRRNSGKRVDEAAAKGAGMVRRRCGSRTL
jgi:hypothetical protein